MEPSIAGAIATVAAYAFGSVPIGFLATWLVAGVDIRRQGSGNIGATNVARVLGAKWGVAILLLDVLKGFLPVLLLPPMLLGIESAALIHGQVSCGIAAIAGHMFPVWLRFRGGKGVATALGVILWIAPVSTLLAAGVFGVTLLAFRIVSLGSMLASVAFAVSQMLLLPHPFAEQSWSLAAFSLLVPLLIILRHRANLGRLFRGEEKKFRPGSLKQSQAEPADPSGQQPHVSEEPAVEPDTSQTSG